jgi:hypothetical protein
LDVTYYNRNIPWYIYGWFDSLLGTNYKSQKELKPPRTGLVFLGVLLRFGRPRVISVFGMTTDSRNASDFVSYVDQKIKKYDNAYMKERHCDASIEIDIMQGLISKKLIEVYGDSQG